MTREGRRRNGGYVSDRGYINSGPLVNGNGMINGNGIINGNGRRRNGNHEEGASKRFVWWFTVFIILVLAFGGVAVMNPPMPPIIPDGNLSEWKGTPGIVDMHTVDDATVDIVEYNVRQISGGTTTYLAGYIKFREVFTSQEGNALYLFISTGASPAYKGIPWISSEYLLRISVTDENSTYGTLMRYTGDGYLWDWSYELSANVGGEGNTIEFLIPFEYNVVKCVYASISSEGIIDITPAFTYGKIPLLITQMPDPDRNEMRIEIYSGGETTLTSITLSVVGNATIDSDIGTYDSVNHLLLLYRTLSAGELLSVHFTIDGTGLTKVSVADVDSDGMVTIRGRGYSKYYGIIDHIEIDGAFEDWKNVPKQQDPSGDVNNPNIDILVHSAVNQNNNTYFYVRVAGQSLEGTPVPLFISKGGPPIERVTGVTYDFIRIYYKEGAETHYIEIRGIDGQIIGTYIDGQPTSAITAATGVGEIEIGTTLDISPNSTYRIVMTDWSGLSDSTSGEVQGIPTTGYRNAGEVVPVPEMQYAVVIPIAMLIVLVFRRRDAQ